MFHFLTMQTDRAAMLDEILDYVKFLRLQVKVRLNMLTSSNINHQLSYLFDH